MEVRMRYVVLAIVFAAGAAEAQLHKCVVNGKVEYRDSACDDLKQRAPVGGNVSNVDAMSRSDVNRVKEETRREMRQQPTAAVIGGGATANISEQDIKNLETKASSKYISQKERDFLLDEARRARAAREGEGSHTKEDAERLQRSQRWTENEKDRRDAEDIHLRKGSPARQAEVLQTRQIQADRENARRAAAGRVITSCDAGGCWGADGLRYNGQAGMYTRSDGATCRKVANQMQCN
jgi:hypothetical protein